MSCLLHRCEPRCRGVTSACKTVCTLCARNAISVCGKGIQNACDQLWTALCSNALCWTSRARPLRCVVPLDPSCRYAAKAAANAWASAGCRAVSACMSALCMHIWSGESRFYFVVLWRFVPLLTGRQFAARTSSVTAAHFALNTWFGWMIHLISGVCWLQSRTSPFDWTRLFSCPSAHSSLWLSKASNIALSIKNSALKIKSVVAQQGEKKETVMMMMSI